ncbi:class I SAM-dependent methyltransferase [Candidatus Thioglobus sp.]|nr:class I SAM-dependent methyltransferase [Candidatus Thioglobus sp.]
MSKVFDAYAAYYDLLYQDKDYKSEVDYVVSLLNKYKVFDGKILELGCGTGKHAEIFADFKYAIHGIDSSISMINNANTQNRKNNVSFEVGDVRNFKTEDLFDAVVSLFHVTSYQTRNKDLIDMFNTASKHIKKGGLFIFDFWYGPAVLNEKPSVRVKHMSDTLFEAERTAMPELNFNENTVNVNFKVSIKNKENNDVKHIEESHLMRYLFLPELRYFLNQADLEILESLSWMSKKELGLNDWQGIIVARKKV